MAHPSGDSSSLFVPAATGAWMPAASRRISERRLGWVLIAALALFLLLDIMSDFSNAPDRVRGALLTVAA